MFTSPVFLLGSALASLWAALFHVFLGKRLSDLVLFWFAGIMGFFLGQFAADLVGLRLLMLGQVHVVEATAACLLAMAIARWLRV
jgi:hypothetical protein